MGFPSDTAEKNLPAMQEMKETRVQFLGLEDTDEEEMATHSSILAWTILWTEEPGGLQYKGMQRAGHGWATEHTHKYCVNGKLVYYSFITGLIFSRLFTEIYP